MKIRLAGPPDVAALTRLVVGFRDHLGAENPTREQVLGFLPEMIADPTTELCLACRDDGTPIGYTNARYFLSLWSTRWEAHLEDLFVLADERRAGTGRTLLENVIARARLRGCGAIGLHTNQRNTDAQAFYRELGFELATEEIWDGAPEQYWVHDLGSDEAERGA